MSAKWQEMFDIEAEKHDLLLPLRWWVVDKITRERLTTKVRPYGYSTKIDAKRGAAQRFKSIQRSLEKHLLGKD